MESSPRTASIIVKDLEQRLNNLYTTRIHDDQTLNDLESFINECSNHVNRLTSSSDPTLITILLPSLLHTIVSLLKICAEKSDTIISGPFLSRDKHTSLITIIKSLYNQIKEFIKLPKLHTIVTKSTQQRHFCEQLHRVSDSVANIDLLIPLICLKLIVKVLTGTDDQQQSQQQVSYIKMEDVNDGLTVTVYESVLKQIAAIYMKNFRDKTDFKEGQFIKVNFHLEKRTKNPFIDF
jgi:hypothetical protein